MSMSTGEVRAPLRKRGEIRVAAIMAAGAELFREKGFDAVTMSDIAARSGTAFGSLYRFFPSKEALADALLAQFALRALNELEALRGPAAGMPAEALAEALLAFILGLQAERGFAMTVVEARGGGEKREGFRRAMRAHMAAVLRACFPRLTRAAAGEAASITLHLLKGAAGTAEQPSAARRRMLDRYRWLLATYLATLQEGSAMP